jgi:hypothetical protein
MQTDLASLNLRLAVFAVDITVSFAVYDKKRNSGLKALRDRVGSKELRRTLGHIHRAIACQTASARNHNAE